MRGLLFDVSYADDHGCTMEIWNGWITAVIFSAPEVDEIDYLIVQGEVDRAEIRQVTKEIREHRLKK